MLRTSLICLWVLAARGASTPLNQNSTAHGSSVAPWDSIPVALLQTQAYSKTLDPTAHHTKKAKCPPPQPCDCHCNCPEIIWPAPPPSPLLPTPMPFFGLLQESSITERKNK